MNAVFLDFATVGPADLDRSTLKAVLPELVFFDSSDDAEMLERIRDAEYVLLNKSKIAAGLIAAAPRLKYIGLAATGVDNVDSDAAASAGVAVTNIRAYCTDSVAQHVFALILALNQRLLAYRRDLQSGAWQAAESFCLISQPIHELRGQTLGIIGLGNLGKGVSRIADAFGMRVISTGRPGNGETNLSLDELLTQSDVISLHCPLTPATKNLMDARRFAQMKPGGLLINTARGGLVDSQALLAALRDGVIGGAAIDVLPQEPPPADDILLGTELDNLIVTPHIAWSAVEARQRALDEMAKNIVAFKAGESRNRIV